jgi:hypothetical protein
MRRESRLPAELDAVGNSARPAFAGAGADQLGTQNKVVTPTFDPRSTSKNAPPRTFDNLYLSGSQPTFDKGCYRRSAGNAGACHDVASAWFRLGQQAASRLTEFGADTDPGGGVPHCGRLAGRDGRRDLGRRRDVTINEGAIFLLHRLGRGPRQ